ncbi:hypothetical protein IV203_014133 [Nitzschia inconspicua]|uniref:Uncharacterized protein n=1 Tax=Nitzschia inconspicua TaxID=303405 RepID=A0A9K3M6L8_9STRA|nr:hypothetical protein IV203_014133 [Nitzschia inconspicua]
MASRNTRYSVDVDILQAIKSDRLVIGSPETNMLDLGIWMNIQAVVTRVHHRRGSHPDALARSVEDTWNNYLSSSAFQNVH